MMLEICEFFSSIQGETSYAGLPCSFIRLSGCNLNCTWCDTRYANEKPTLKLTIEQVLQQLHDFSLDLVCITGGEPLLQEDTPELVSRACIDGYTTLVETNGSFDISLLKPPAIRILDLKAPSSGESAAINWHNLDLLLPEDEIKIVISDKEDYNWAKKIILQHQLLRRVTVLLSPITETVLPSCLAEWILADKLQVKLQIQLHRIIWPNIRRGV